MTKDGFIRQLEESLQGEIAESELNDTLMYYQEYINEEILRGQTEEEVLEGLGSPRLIAKSVIEAHGAERPAIEETEYVQDENGETVEDDMRKRRYNGGTGGQLTIGTIAGIVVFVGVLLAVGFLLVQALPFILLFGLGWWIYQTLTRR